MGMQMEMECGPCPRPRARLPPCPRPERAPTSVSTWWYETRRLQAAAVCIRTRALAEIEKRGCGCGCGCGASTSFPSPSSSASSSSCAAGAVCIRVTPRTRRWVQACTHVRMKPAPSYSYSRGSSCDRVIEAGCPCVCAPALLSAFYADTEGARSADLGLILGLDAQSRVDDGADVEFARVRRGCAYNLLSLALAPISLSFSSNSVGSLYSARFDVCMASHPHPLSTSTRPSLNETSS
ncbi:hypothetical protein B0H13DRAFT_1154836 [Mycena leptocephala]|nr:hypothetical protein B0H13DRAFT_1154836 [Mycena leptocephala]